MTWAKHQGDSYQDLHGVPLTPKTAVLGPGNATSGPLPASAAGQAHQASPPGPLPQSPLTSATHTDLELVGSGRDVGMTKWGFSKFSDPWAWAIGKGKTRYGFKYLIGDEWVHLPSYPFLEYRAPLISLNP